MADENKLEIGVSADTKEFDAAIDKSSKKAGESLKKGIEKPATDSLKNVASYGEGIGEELASKIGDGISSRFPIISKIITNPMIGAFTAAGALGAKIISDAFEGEAIKKIEKNFDNVAKSFGVAGDELFNAFQKNTGGLIDNTEILKILSEDMVTFSGQVEKLPELYNVAKKAAYVFGKDSKEVFSQLTFAAQSGNTRGLRFLFPKLDLEKEYEKAAIGLGKLKSELTDTEKQQIAVNKLLEEGANRLSGVKIETSTLTSEWKRLNVTYTNIREEFEKGAAEGSLASLTKDLIKSVRELLETEEKRHKVYKDDTVITQKEREKFLTDEIAKAEKQRFDAGIQGYDGFLASQKKQLEQLQKSLDLQKQAEKTPVLDILKPQFQTSIIPSIFPTGGKGSEEQKQQDQVSAGRLKAQQDFLKQYENNIYQSRQNLLNANFAADKSEANAQLIHLANKEQIDRDFNSRKQQIGKELLDKGLIDQETYQNGTYTRTQLYNDAIVLLETDKNARIESENKAHFDRLKSTYDAFGSVGLENAQIGFSNFFEANRKELFNMSQFTQKATTKMRDSMVGGFVAAAKGQGNALEIMKNQFLEYLGTVAIQQGVFMMFDAFSTFPAIKLPELAAGAGLVALGSALVGGSGAATPSASGGGVTGGYEGNYSNLTSNNTSNISNTGVTVNIQGSVYDMDQTGRQIADVVASAFQTQGVKIYD